MLQTCVSQDSLMIVISLIALPCQKSGAFHCLNLPVLRMCHHWGKKWLMPSLMANTGTINDNPASFYKPSKGLPPRASQDS